MTVSQLKPTLGTLHLWGIAVGLVISGEYFGWSYGWAQAGTLGAIDELGGQQQSTGRVLHPCERLDGDHPARR